MRFMQSVIECRRLNGHRDIIPIPDTPDGIKIQFSKYATLTITRQPNNSYLTVEYQAGRFKVKSRANKYVVTMQEIPIGNRRNVS